ncbi:MAG: hypothetical protein PVG65_01140 [Candidatus Thorarchaeota archaeon]|jgi:hypothetical protein
MRLEDFNEWLKDLVYPRDVEDFIEVLYDGGEAGPEETIERKKEIAIYTDHNVYYITAIEREGKKGYLGCQVNARKARAGETWLRGNDLPDGPFIEETLQRIKQAIIAYELVPLSVRSIQQPIEEIKKSNYVRGG